MLTLTDHTLAHQGVMALNNISVHIAHGEKVALLGASGAGKSSLLEALRKQVADQAAWCPQDGGLVPMLSVFHNIYMGALTRHSTLHNLRNLIAPSTQQKQTVGLIAESLGITEKLMTSVDRLSGGQAQRTALGRALYSRRPLLLADEPLSGIDTHQGKTLLNDALNAHKTAVVALHDQQLALACFDRIIGLQYGRIIMDKKTSELSLASLQSLYQ